MYRQGYSLIGSGITIFQQIQCEILLTLLYFRDFFGGGVPQVYDNMSPS